MPGLLAGLELARRALLAHQSVLTVTGHNIANSATPGFSRRTGILEVSPPEQTPEGTLGSGVTFAGVERKRDLFLDAQTRNERALAGRWEARAETLARVESVLNEPSDSGLTELLNQFWNAWLDLSNTPEDFATRTVIVQKGSVLVDGFRQQDQRIVGVLDGSERQMEQLVERVNVKLEELAQLNGEIGVVEGTANEAADLQDRRDLLLDELADLAGASHSVRSDGQTSVRIGGRTVVQGNSVERLTVERVASDTTAPLRVVFELDRSPLSNVSGQLGGLIEVRDEVIPSLRQELETLALKVSGAVNRIHETGPSRRRFFQGSKLSDFEVDPELVSDPSQVNAGTSGDSGDNDIALAIAALRDARILSNGSAKPGEYWASTVTGLGSLVQQAQLVSQGQANVVKSLEGQRQAASGVNLDEELARLVESQRAYQAAARLFTVFDDLYQTLLAI